MPTSSADAFHRYGYLVTGSQSMGFGAWGNINESKSETYQCVRFEIGVGIFPYTEDNSRF